MGDGSAADCLVCRKHQEQGPLVPGGPVAEDELVLVSHIAPADTLGGQGTTAYLGQLLVEPRRHAPGLADLTDVEAGQWACGARGRAAHCGIRPLKTQQKISGRLTSDEVTQGASTS